MKLDLLVTSLRGGGAERVAVNLANALVEEGHEVRLLTMAPLSEVEYHPVPGVTLVSLHDGRPPARNPVRRILSRLVGLRRRLTAAPRPDVLIAVQANIAIEAGLACLGSGLRIIGCEHNIPSRSVRGRLWIWLRPFAYRRMSAVTTLTRGAHQELAPLCGATPLKVIPNALRLPLGVTEPQLDPCDFVPDGAPLLLAMGRMVPAKGFDILIQRFADLAAQHPDAHLVILGDGPLRAELTEQVARLGLGARVSLPGRTGNVAQWYTRAALYLMTSRWEGMPMVLLETMGHGTVPVVTDFRHGPRDVIRDGIDGVILPEADEALWQETVLRLLADPERRAEMSARALEVRTRFGEPMVMQAWAELLAQVAPEKV